MAVPRTTGWLEHGGERIYYERAGAGPAVVLTHGLGGNHAVWWHQVAALAASREVITWDQRGFGNSSRRTGLVGPEPAVGDLAALLDHLELDAVDVVGQSMGGWVAMGFAIQHRGRLRSLVLADSPGGVLTDDVRAAAREARGRLRTPGTFGRHPALGDHFCDERPAEAMLYDLIGGFGDKPPDAEMIELLTACRWPVEQVAAVEVPVLLLCGEHDPMAPPEGVRAVAAVLRDARVEVIPGCGHSPYVEAPEAWNAAVTRFLDEVA